jgi:hypothetical protein
MVSISLKEVRIVQSGHVSISGSRQSRNALQCARPRARRRSITAFTRNMPMTRRRVSWQKLRVRVAVCHESWMVFDRIPNEHRIKQAIPVKHLHLLAVLKLLLTSKDNVFIARMLPHHLISLSAGSRCGGERSTLSDPGPQQDISR